MSTSLTASPSVRPSSTTMLEPQLLHAYQKRAARHQLQHPGSMLWLDTGLGKTVITLTTIAARFDAAQVSGVLLVAPLRVCQTVWQQEAAKWSHTKHLTFSRLTGDADQRHYGLRRRAHIYLVNYENIGWLAEEINTYYLSRGQYPPFNMLVSDEVTKLKDPSTQRHGALRTLIPYIPYRTGLTGTPASNGYKDLFGQYLAIDMGERLGRDKKAFEDAYMMGSGYMGYQKVPKVGAEEAIRHRISDITLEMGAEDYLDLPPVIINDIMVDLPPAARAQYDELEQEMFTALDDGTEVEVFNAAALTNKCLQAANGAVYHDPEKRDEWAKVHDAKLEALDDIIEEAAGKPILLLHQFRHDRERIMKRYPWAESLKSSLGEAKIMNMVERWNRGEIPLMIGHPASIGHGLNLQKGGHTMVWFGLNWSLELYMQANARLHRQGQEHPFVMIHRILARDTLDSAVAEALEGKAATQKDLRAAIKHYQEGTANHV